ncbi:MAG: methyltransferase domain-containing protein [Pseudomonadota bacterium]
MPAFEIRSDDFSKDSFVPSMKYDDAVAERLEAIYLGADVAAQRQETLRRIAISDGETVLDVGSGPGFLAQELARATGPNGCVIGVDISEQMVERTMARNTCDWLAFQVADAGQLPFEDNSFDVVVSTQVAEYVPDIDAFCAEMYRVLRPGGRALIMATDWDAVCWHSSDPDRMARVLSAFAPHCADSRLPRTLGALLRGVGFHLDSVSFFPIINIDWYDGCYSAGIIQFIVAYISGQGTLADAELTAWADDLA